MKRILIIIGLLTTFTGQAQNSLSLQSDTKYIINGFGFSVTDEEDRKDVVTNMLIGGVTLFLQQIYTASFPLNDVVVDGVVESQYSNAGFLFPINNNGISKKRNWEISLPLLEMPFLNRDRTKVLGIIEFSPVLKSKSIGFFNKGEFENYSTMILAPNIEASTGYGFSPNFYFGLKAMFGYDFKLNKTVRLENATGLVSKGDKSLLNNNFSYSVMLGLNLFKTVSLSCGYSSDIGNFFKDKKINYTYRAIVVKAGLNIL